jgi:diacylglycerol O-acyltransferase / wax synthase
MHGLPGEAGVERLARPGAGPFAPAPRRPRHDRSERRDRDGALSSTGMGYSHAERLSALDASFLELEDPRVHRHVGAVVVFEAAPLRGEDGGLDVDRIRELVDASLHGMPRYRQRLAHIPVFDWPVWVDDEHFNLLYHVRHVGLPRPGTERQLKRLAGQLLGQPLDRSKPLWELWVVEGLEGDRFAIVSKTHHCMIDGVGSAELMASSMQLAPDGAVPGAHGAPRWVPRPAPGPTDLFVAEAARRAGGVFGLARSVLAALRDPRGAVDTLREGAESVGEALVAGLRRSSPTPLNVEIGPHRRFDWLRFELAEVREVKERLGGTVNDVVLAVVAGALRHFLAARGEDVGALDFRVLLPVNVRRRGDRAMGNRVTLMATRLPLDEHEPGRRLQRVVEATRQLKRSHQARGVELIEEMSDWTATSLFTLMARLGVRSRPFNLVVTNVPGPQQTAYLLGAPLRAVYPLVPLYGNQALGIALFSYDGGLFWGLNADWDALPDLHEVAEALGTSFEQLRKAAADAPARRLPRSRRAARSRQPAAPKGPPA